MKVHTMRWVRQGAIAAIAASTALSVGVAMTPATAATIAPTTKSATGPDWLYPASAMTVADVAKAIRADVAYKAGYTGKGVGVALIDTGVLPVDGLTSGNVVNGPDLSLESQVPGLQHKDTYGHGTHLAGIIAGRDNTTGTGFRGIAPDAKLTSIKVGAANGSVDVTQVMAAIDWTVKHRNDDPANPIRVINLSYGTDGIQQTGIDPLVAAVDNAFKAGILVVVAGGNNGVTGKLTNPAISQSALLVGSADSMGTTNPIDDVISDFTSQVVVNRGVSMTAPGRSIVSLRAPGGFADANYPTARVGDRFFKGSGSSQAAAVTSGAAALIAQKFPTATPAQLSAAIMFGTSPWVRSTVTGRGTGVLNVENVIAKTSLTATLQVATSNGTGTLQGARGTSAVTFSNDTQTLTGERDLFGPFDVAAWYKASVAGTSWSGGTWMGHGWTGDTMGATLDGQATWTGRTWSGRTWSGRTWSDVAWADAAWSGRTWSSSLFNGRTWSGAAWQAGGWLTATGGGWTV
jgi:serine protease AprX